MVATFTAPPTAEPVNLYGVMIQSLGWIHQLFLASELRPVGVQLHLGSEAEVLVGEFQGRTGTIKRVLKSTDFQHINGYRREGWQIPLGQFAISSPQPDKLARFQECDQAVDRFLSSWQEAAKAMRAIEEDRLWEVAGFPSNRAYWVAKGEASAKAGLPQVSYERVMQLIGATKTAEALETAGVPVEAFTSEKALRAVRSAPEGQQAAVAAAVVAEHHATGRPVTEPLVKKVAAEVAAGLTLAQMQQAYAPYGVLKQSQPMTRKAAHLRFEFTPSPTGASVFFKDLSEAQAYFAAKVSTRPPSSDMGCPTCANCTLVGGGAECDKKGWIEHPRIWNAPSWCGSWELDGEADQPPQPPAIAEHTSIPPYLSAAGYWADSVDGIVWDDGCAYRGWYVATESAGDLLSVGLQHPGGDWYLATLMDESPLNGLDVDGAIAYSKQVVDGAIAIQGRAGQLRLVEPEVVAPSSPQESIHQRMVASASTRKEPSPHDENNTPAALWQPALTARGLAAYTLDPMTNADATVPATVQWTMADDCFAQPTWRVGEHTFLWANPAFSLNDDFSQRFIQELESGHIDEALILDKADSRTAWGQRLLAKADLIVRIFGYTKFENAARENGAATFPLELLYYGTYGKEIAQAYQHLGLVTVPYKF